MKGFFSRRWRGEVPLRILLWRDMLAVGSVVNLACTVAALMLASGGASLGMAATVHFAPLPYNGFLFATVWNSPQRSVMARAIAALWLAMMTVA